MKKIFITCLLLFSYLITTANVNPKAQELANRQGMSFTENRGQVSDTKGNLRPDVLYTAENNGVKIYFRKDAISYVFPKIETVNGESTITGIYRSDVELVGANANFRVVSEKQVAGVSNFYFGKNKAVGVKSFQKIVYQNIYENIDLAFYTTGSNNSQLKYEFVVRPGGKVEDIKLRYNGATSATINRTGGVDVATPFGNMNEDAPYTYQNGKEIASSFQLSNGVMTYKVGAFDPSAILVIDPLTRQFATNYGGRTLDRAHGVAIDANGNTTIAGYTTSPNFPVTAGAIQSVNNGTNDVIVASFAPDGSRRFATYMGGSASDMANEVSLDNNGNATVVGITGSTNLVSSNTYRGGSTDGFISQFNSTGALNWSMFWGGAAQDELTGVANWANGDITVIGRTFSSGLNTIGNNLAGGRDAYLARLTSAGTMVWGAYFGGSGDDQGRGITVDGLGNVIAAGQTTSTGLATSGAVQATNNGGTDAFVAKFNGNGVRQWSTYLGGTGLDLINNVTTNSSNSIFVTGQTGSTTFPTSGAFQSVFGGGTDAFVSGMNPDGSLIMSSFIGGSSTDQGYGIATVAGKVYVTGSTNSPNFPLLNPNANPSLPNQGAIAGAFDIFTVRVDGTTRNRDWSFIYGGSADDIARDISANGSGAMSIAGYTNSANVPLLNAVQGQLAAGTGNDDALIINLKDDVSGCPAFVVTSTNTNPGCAGNDGMISVATPTAGKAPFMYSVNGGAFQAGSSFSGLSAGAYVVTVKDANNCSSSSASMSLTQTSTSRINIDVVQGAALRCNGDKTQLTINASLGTAPYQYQLNETGAFQIQNVFTNVSGGAFSITVKDAKGCIATTSGMVMEPGAITFDPQVTDANCATGTRAMVNVNVTGGGTMPYAYSIDGGMNFNVNSVFTGLLPGVVNIIVRDANGCTTGAALPVQINSVGGVMIMDDQVISSNPTCGGESNGTITVVATSGRLPYTFSLNNGTPDRTVNTSTFSFEGLSAGNYTVTVKDGGGCMDSKMVQLNDPKPLKVTSAQALQPTSCVSNNGALTITAVGGEEPYAYSIDNGQTFQFSNMFEGLRSGTYQIMVRDRNGNPNACTATFMKELTQLNAGARILSVEKRDPICSNSDALYTSGEIVIKAIGNANLLYYSIDNGLNYISSATGGITFNYLSPGFYKIRVSESPSNACSEYREVTLETPDVVRIVSVSTDQPACGMNPYIGGTISVTAAGGSVGVYKYSLDGGTTFQDSEVFTNLVPRPEGFNIRVIDNSPNGCVADYPTVFLNNPSGLMMTKPSIKAPQCGKADGMATTAPSGGTLPYTFFLDGVMVSQNVTSNASFTYNNLTEGRHMLEVRDAKGCRAESEINLKVVLTRITPTNAMSDACVYSTSSATSAASGKIKVDITTTSNGPFRYTLKGTRFSSCSTATSFPTYNSVASNARTFTFEPTNGNYIAPGMYIVEVRDLSNADNCVTSDTVEIQHQNPLNQVRTGRVTNVAVSNKNCNFTTGTGAANTGSITVSHVGLNRFHLIDQKGIWRTQTTGSFVNLAAGNYRLWTGTCGGGNTTSCLYYEGAYTITQPTPIVVKVTTTQTDCGANPLGRVVVTATGGQALQFAVVNNSALPDYPFATYDNNTFVIDNIDPNTIISANQIQIRQLGSTNNCQYNYPLPIQFNKTSNLSIAQYGVNTPAGCSNVNNGATTAKVMTGTVAPYSYFINGVLSTTTNAIQHKFENLRPGYHVVMVKDANGCARSYRTLVNVDPDLFSFNVMLLQHSGSITCNDGAVQITLTGDPVEVLGNDFMLSINGGGSFSSPTNEAGLQAWLDLAGLPSGTYEFVLKRASNLCEIRKTVTIGNTNVGLSPININYIKYKNPTCPDGSDGSIEVSVTMTSVDPVIANNFVRIQRYASPTPVTVNDPLFENIANTGTFVVKASGLSAGTFNLDINNMDLLTTACRINNDTRLNITISNPVTAPITISNVAVTRPDCGANPTGTIVINATGGIGQLEYSINGGISWQTSPTFAGISAGTKFSAATSAIRVRQVNNTCSSTEVAWTRDEAMTLPSGLDHQLTVTQPGCDGLSKGKIVYALLQTTLKYPVSITVNGNASNVVVFTTPGDVNTFSLNDLGPGSYTFRAIDAAACTLSTTATISTGDNIAVNFNSRNTTACGNSDGQIDYTLIGGDVSANDRRQRRLIANGIEEAFVNYGVLNTISSGNLVYPSLSSGLYFIEVKNVNDNCVSSSAPIFINDPNSATVSRVVINAPNNQNCNNGSIVVTLGGVGSGNIRYEISKDRGLTWMSATPNNGGQTSPFFTALTEGRYFLRVRSGFSAPFCYRYADVGTLKCTFGQTKVADATTENNLSVYPNPTQSSFALNFTANAAEVVGVKVLDVTGRLVSNQNFNAIEGANSFDVNISNEASGVYMVQVTTANGVNTLKVVKE